MRFRSEELNFKVAQVTAAEAREMGLGIESESKVGQADYPAVTKTLTSKEEGRASFTLHVEAGSFTDGEIIGLLGQNGMGKTTYRCWPACTTRRKMRKTRNARSMSTTQYPCWGS